MPTSDQAALALLSALVLEDGRRWGDAAVRVQWDDAAAVLDTSGPRRHWLSRARGFSKTSDVGGVSAVIMLCQLAAGSAAYAGAADRDQARLLAEKIRGFVQRTPELQGALDVQANRVIALRSGVTLDILAADAASAYGLTPALLVIDELCQWPNTANARGFLDALITSLPKVPGSRLVVISTNGDPAHWSKRVYDQARKSKLWRVSEVPGPAPWQDPAELAEQQATLMPSVYSRLFGNAWTASEDRLVDPADLDAAMALDGVEEPRTGHNYVITLDIGLRNDRTVLVVAHRERSTRWSRADRYADAPDPDRGDAAVVVVDRLDRWRGTPQHPVQLSEVEGIVEELAHRYYHARVVMDPWQGVGLAQRLRSRGVRVDEHSFTAQSVGRLAHALFQALRNRKLLLPAEDDVLRDELSNVRLRETSPGVFRMDHDSGRHDDQAIAIALAVEELLTGPDGAGAVRWYRDFVAARGGR